ncbi:MAG: hypothetical protein GWN86_07115, partial [Desulfobacterales bacterium]|nr:hypothetical protein [Desulfobacterales bacterium]
TGTALVRTPDLYGVARYLADGPDPEFAASCRKAILNTQGKLVVFPVVPEKDVAETTESADKES